jgi:hypothetical protein
MQHADQMMASFPLLRWLGTGLVSTMTMDLSAVLFIKTGLTAGLPPQVRRGR